MQLLDKKGVQIVDTTCPWVSKVRVRVGGLKGEGFRVRAGKCTEERKGLSKKMAGCTPFSMPTPDSNPDPNANPDDRGPPPAGLDGRGEAPQA